MNGIGNDIRENGEKKNYVACNEYVIEFLFVICYDILMSYYQFNGWLKSRLNCIILLLVVFY